MKRLRTLSDFITPNRGERGATALEFALVAPVFLLFILGIVDFGRLFWVKNLMQYGAEQTARYAMVSPSATDTDLETYANTEVGDLQDGIAYAVNTETIDGVKYRIITASSTFKFLMPLLTSDLALGAKARTPVNEL